MTFYQSFLASLAALGLAVSLTACGASPEPTTLPETTPLPEITAAPQTEAPDGLAELRQDMAPAIAGILYLGFGEEGLTSPSIAENIREKGYHTQYPFLQDIDSDHTVVTEGYELYCIIPADPAASVDVNVLDAETGVTGDTLYQSRDGAPFLLMCNTSDIMSNVTVSIVDSQGAFLSLYSPGISLRDGCVLLPGEDQPPVLDLTRY